MQFNKISICLLTDDYERVAYTLPTPTYRAFISKYKHQGFVCVTYEIKHSITTAKQLLWVSNIKHSIKHYIKCDFEFIEYIKRDNDDFTGHKYSLEELSKYFKSVNKKYPKIFYPADKNEMYKKLVWYAKSLYYYDYLYIEMVMYASIKMNNNLTKPNNQKELISKSMRAFIFIDKNKHKFKQKLNDRDRKQAFINAGNKRGQQMTIKKEQNKQMIKEKAKDKKYIKANGKINISLLAKDIEMTRQTVNKQLKELQLLIYPLFFIPKYLLDSVVL